MFRGKRKTLLRPLIRAPALVGKVTFVRTLVSPAGDLLFFARAKKSRQKKARPAYAASASQRYPETAACSRARPHLAFGRLAPHSGSRFRRLQTGALK